MSKNFPLVLLTVMIAVGLFSCKKTYVCNCYTQHKIGPNANRPSKTYELYEYDRKRATYKCRSRNDFNKYNSMETVCSLGL